MDKARRGPAGGSRLALTIRLGLVAGMLVAAGTVHGQLSGAQVSLRASGNWIDAPYGWIDPNRSGSDQYDTPVTSLPADSRLVEWDTAASAFASADLLTGKLRASTVTATPPIYSGSSESPTGYLVGSGWGGSSANASALFSDVITVFGDFTQEAWGTVRIHLKGSLEILQEPYVAYRWGDLPTEHGGGYAEFAFVSAVNGELVRRELIIRHPDENTVVEEVIEQRFRLDWLPANWPVESPDPNGQRFLFLHSTLSASAGSGGVRVSFQNTADFELELPPGYTFTSELGFLSAVPEPHEYGLLAGAGLLGFALWRRRAKA